MGMTVEQLAAARGRTVQDVLDAARRADVLAWSGFTPLDEQEVASIDQALAAATSAPADPAGATPGWGAPVAPVAGGPPPPPPYGAPPPPPYGAPPPPPPVGYGAPPPGAPYPGGPYPAARPPKAPRFRGAGRGLGILVAVLVSVGVRAGASNLFGDEDEQARDSVADVLGAEAGDDVADDLAAFALEVGDCFDDHSELATDPNQTVDARIEEVPCDGPHDAEVYAVPHHPDLPGAPYPGESSIIAFADEACFTQFEPFVGLPFEQSTLVFVYTFPQADSWRLLDDRAIACSVVTFDGSPLAGTMRGSQR